MLSNILGFIRARRTDPLTSHAAATASEDFSAAHADRIVACLDVHGPLGKDGIARLTGLDGVAIARRLPELERQGLVELTGRKVCSMTGRLEREWASAQWVLQQCVTH